MKNPLIHIGYHKTATTSLQKSFYPFLHESDFIPRDIVTKYLLEPRPFDFDPKSAREGMMTGRNNRIIISDELLSGHMNSGGHHGFLTKGIADRLKQAFPEATIVISIRNQIDIVASVYRNYIKRGGNYPIDKFLYHPWNYQYMYPLFAFEHFDYCKLIDYYVSLFGKEKVYVFLYEEFAKDNLKFIKKYCQDLHLSIDWDSFEVAKCHVGFSNFVLGVAKFFYSFIYVAPEEGRFSPISIPVSSRKMRQFLSFINALERKFNHVFKREIDTKRQNERLLGPENIEYIRGFYGSSNTKLQNEYGLPLSQYGYPLKG